jgi:hypothetical protein
VSAGTLYYSCRRAAGAEFPKESSFARDSSFTTPKITNPTSPAATPARNENNHHERRRRGIGQHSDGSTRRHDDDRDPAGADLDRPYRRPVPRLASWPPNRCRDVAWRWGRARLRRNTGRERVQIRIGPSHQSAADPVVKVFFSKLPLHECGLQYIDRPLPVSVRDPHMAMSGRTR